MPQRGDEAVHVDSAGAVPVDEAGALGEEVLGFVEVVLVDEEGRGGGWGEEPEEVTGESGFAGGGGAGEGEEEGWWDGGGHGCGGKGGGDGREEDCEDCL